MDVLPLYVNINDVINAAGVSGKASDSSRWINSQKVFSQVQESLGDPNDILGISYTPVVDGIHLGLRRYVASFYEHFLHQVVLVHGDDLDRRGIVEPDTDDGGGKGVLVVPELLHTPAWPLPGREPRLTDVFLHGVGPDLHRAELAYLR